MQITTKLLGALLISTLFTASPVSGQQGYKVIKPAQPTRTGDKIEVLEIFWYGCPHCYSFEPLLAAWKPTLAEDVVFRRMPAVLNKNWIAHARAFFAAERMGVLEQVHLPLFKALHQDRKRIYSKAEIIDFVGGLGIDTEAFEMHYDSNETEIKMKSAFIQAQRFKLTGVPAVVVNGKYLVSATLSGSLDDMLTTVDALIDGEREQP